jgi:hypothetical protein
MKWKAVEINHTTGGNIDIDEMNAPFDGEPVLVKTNTGIVEAWWQKGEPYFDHEGTPDCDGFQWICYDDAFQVDLEEVTHWMPLPDPPKED